MSDGRLSILLHSHMPYVEGFGTWPFGEEWLFEAMASSYVPLLDVLPGSGITVSVTPVLADQLEAPGVSERFAAFLRDVRPASHALDAEQFRAEGRSDEAAELERAAGDYAWAADRFAGLGEGGLLDALSATWTSSATHAVLPLLATDAGVRLQLDVGIEAHRTRAGGHWDGGFWLPECAYEPWLDPLLEAAGVRTACVDLTDVLGRGAPEQLRPLATEDGPLLVSIDREIIELVWSPGGYPSQGAYREYHRRSPRDHHPWSVDGAVYDPARAEEQLHADAADFVARVASRLGDGGLCVVALDTELLGHWWYEGPRWLGAVVEECARRGVEIAPLDEAAHAIAPAGPLPPERLGTTTWGTPRDLSTWDHPGVAELAWRARAAELEVLAAGPHPPPRAVRELLALQSSDWAFLETRALAGTYPAERAVGHHA
ncbi:MAG: hypothetical protein H0V81_15440, partial [Solirubrobacterales bacterium]|nr:hypothetical protein [Solirubrobacterales bacterium]